MAVCSFWCMIIHPPSALTKYHRLGSLNIRNVLLTVLEAGKPKFRMLADSVLEKVLFLACRWCPSQFVLRWTFLIACVQILQGHQSCWIRPPPSWPYLTLIALSPKSPSPHWGLGLQHRNFGVRGKQFSLNILSYNKSLVMFGYSLKLNDNLG